MPRTFESNEINMKNGKSIKVSLTTSKHFSFTTWFNTQHSTLEAIKKVNGKKQIKRT